MKTQFLAVCGQVKLAVAVGGIVAVAQAAPGVSIDQVTPICAPGGITTACQPGGFFSAFPGRYTVHLKIGERRFQDGLEITYITRHPGMLGFAEVVAGYFSVPSANYLGAIQDGKIVLDVRTGQSFQLSFRILMRENGQSFPVYFDYLGPNVENACGGDGTAYLDQARTQILGTFTLTKQAGECGCPKAGL